MAADIDASAQVHELVAPEQEDVAAVLDWLQEHTPSTVSPSGDWIRAKLSISHAEQLLNATFLQMHHEASGLTVHRARRYSLPAHIHQAIDIIEPTIRLPPVHKSTKQLPPVHKSTKRTLAVPPSQGMNTPKRLRALYNITVEGSAPRNSMAVTAFREQHYDLADFEEYKLLWCHEGIQCGKGLPLVVGDGNQGLHLAGGEVMLDIQTITGVAGNVAAQVWSFSGRSEDNYDNEPYTKWLATLSNTSDDQMPLVFSTSYGDDERSWSVAAAARMNVEFQKAGARGVTIIFASGDAGANCEGDPTTATFSPETPSSSPW